VPVYKDTKLIFVIMVGFLTNVVYTLIAPFMPLEFTAKGVDENMIGVVVGIMALARIVASFAAGNFIHKIQSRTGLSIGLISVGLSIQGFGMLEYLDSPTTIVVLALVLRII